MGEVRLHVVEHHSGSARGRVMMRVDLSITMLHLSDPLVNSFDLLLSEG